MSRLILPSVRTTQPQQAVEINWSNPLTKSLVGCWIPASSKNIAGNSNLFFRGSLLVNLAGVYNNFSASVSTEQSIIASSEVSFATDFICGSGSGNVSVLAQGPTSGANNLGFALNSTHASSQYAGAIYTGAGYSIIGKPTGAALQSGTRYQLGMSLGVGSGSIYNNGLNTGTQSGLSTKDTTGRLALGNDSGLSSTMAPAPNFAYYYQWSRRLSDAEQLSIAQNPWQIFAPQPSRLFFVPDATLSPQKLCFTQQAINRSNTY